MRRTALFFAGLMLSGLAVSGQQSDLPIIAPAPPEASCARTAIACDTSVDGSIEETDCKISRGSYADVYELKASEKLLVTLQMHSAEFDSYLIFREERGLQPVPAMDNRPIPVMVHDDNGGGGTNAQLSAATEPPGLWIITAQGKKRGSHGPYTLTVKCEGVR